MARPDLLQSLNDKIAGVERTLAEIRVHIRRLRESGQDTKEAEAQLDKITTLQNELRNHRAEVARQRAKGTA